ncbi:hypothetical protein B484DRAFT_398053, partial [Ochromonadaceae sp. CCMP2298]
MLVWLIFVLGAVLAIVWRADGLRSQRPSPWTSALSSFDDTRETVSSLEIELDYMGQVNFCLRTSDFALSGPSRSKVVNEITNDVYR